MSLTTEAQLWSHLSAEAIIRRRNERKRKVQLGLGLAVVFTIANTMANIYGHGNMLASVQCWMTIDIIAGTEENQTSSFVPRRSGNISSNRLMNDSQASLQNLTALLKDATNMVTRTSTTISAPAAEAAITAKSNTNRLNREVTTPSPFVPWNDTERGGPLPCFPDTTTRKHNDPVHRGFLFLKLYKVGGSTAAG